MSQSSAPSVLTFLPRARCYHSFNMASKGTPKEPNEASAPTGATESSTQSPIVPVLESEKGLSKSELKKLAKKKEKEEKVAKLAEQERERKAAAEASDTSKGLYGKFEHGIAPAKSQEHDRKRTKLLDIAGGDSTKYESTEVTVRARVHNARGQSAKLAFLDLRERTENIQAVIGESEGPPPVSRLMVKWCSSLSRESVVLATGVLKRPVEPVQSATISNLELHIRRCFVISEGPEQLPMQVKDAMHSPPVGDDAEAVEGQLDATGTPIVTMSTRLNNRVLSLRTPLDQAIFAINGKVCQLFQEYMLTHHFEQLQTPKIAGAATEGGSNVFEVKYFNGSAFLTQSPQFYKQMAIAGDMERVFEIGPVFRAENSNTPRHLTEFTGLDFEMEIEKSWEEVIDLAENLLVFIFRGLRERCRYQMGVVQREYPDAGNFKIPEGRAPRLRFSEGIQMLKDAGIEAPADDDISTANEKALGKLVLEKYGSDFFVMTHYPSAVRPFYTHLAPEDEKVTHSYDAFMRGQEIISGAQRIHEPDMLMKRMRSMDPPLDPESEGFKYYVDSFRMGCAPHGGGGMGLNRITMLWLGLGNIRQATLFPRDPQRKVP